MDAGELVEECLTEGCVEGVDGAVALGGVKVDLAANAHFDNGLGADLLAAERGGNCEVTRAEETVVEGGATVLGPTNLPSTVPAHASQMYAHNMATFIQHLRHEQRGSLHIDMDDEIPAATLVTPDRSTVPPPLPATPRFRPTRPTNSTPPINARSFSARANAGSR